MTPRQGGEVRSRGEEWKGKGTASISVAREKESTDLHGHNESKGGYLMKVAINACYGGFRIPDEVCEKLHCNRYDGDTIKRNNPELIEALEEWLKTHVQDRRKDLSFIKIVTIPDDITDWMIIDYDGIERVIFVHDGTLLAID